MNYYSKIKVPLPFCVATEQHLVDSIEEMFEDNRQRREIKANEWDEIEYMDSQKYENDFCAILNKHLDFDCCDDVLYIKAKGDDNARKDSLISLNNSTNKDWTEIIEKKFCLLNNVDSCEIEMKPLTKKSDDDQFLFIDPTSELDEPLFNFNFVKCSNKSKKYDKIIIKNCMKYFDRNYKYFCKFIMTLFKEQFQMRTSLLIVQRVSDLNTLPFHSKVKKDWTDTDCKFIKFMQTLQNEFFNIKFDIETLTFSFDCKSTWYSNLKDKIPFPLNQGSLLVDEQAVRHKELVHGIRELNEGVFKYQQINNYIELKDRMIFIAAYREFSKSACLEEKMKNKKDKKSNYDPKIEDRLNDDIKMLKLEITPDLRQLVNSVKCNNDRKIFKRH
jgi:hypothetical protein